MGNKVNSSMSISVFKTYATTKMYLRRHDTSTQLKKYVLSTYTSLDTVLAVFSLCVCSPPASFLLRDLAEGF